MATKKGKAGGEARAAALTPERRRNIAKMGAAKRWGINPTQEAPEPPGIESQPVYYVGGKYRLEDGMVALVGIIDSKWAVCQVDDFKPFVTQIKNLKK